MARWTTGQFAGISGSAALGLRVLDAGTKDTHVTVRTGFSWAALCYKKYITCDMKRTEGYEKSFLNGEA